MPNQIFRNGPSAELVHGIGSVRRLMRFSLLFVTAMYPHPARPGSGAFVMHQVEALRALGHRVDVVHVKGYSSRWNYLRGAAAVLRATWSGNYDVVHVHYGITGLCALVRWRTPMVVTLHGSDVLRGRLQPLVSRLVSALADATIAVSPAVNDVCAGTLIPCGVDLEVFRPKNQQSARRALGLPAGGRIVLFPFDPERRVKRFDIVSAAVRKLGEQGLGVVLLPVWNAPNGQMPLYYSAADAMVLCSDTEGSPTSVKEALACDLPVVSTDVGDVREVTRGINGVEICEQDANSIAGGLARVFARDRATTHDARSAMARYGQHNTAEALIRVYERVLERHPRSRARRACARLDVQ